MFYSCFRRRPLKCFLLLIDCKLLFGLGFFLPNVFATSHQSAYLRNVSNRLLNNNDTCCAFMYSADYGCPEWNSQLLQSINRVFFPQWYWNTEVEQVLPVPYFSGGSQSNHHRFHRVSITKNANLILTVIGNAWASSTREMITHSHFVLLLVKSQRRGRKFDPPCSKRKMEIRKNVTPPRTSCNYTEWEMVSEERSVRSENGVCHRFAYYYHSRPGF